MMIADDAVLRSVELLSLHAGAAANTGEPADPSPAAKAHAAWMWWHLDNNTHPQLLARRRSTITWPSDVPEVDAAFRVRAINDLFRWLCVRSEARWRMTQELGRTPVASDGASIRAAVARWDGFLDASRWLPHIAHLVQRCIDGHYPRLRADGAVASGFADACRWFGSGELTLTRSVTQPFGPLAKAPVSQGAPEGAALCLFAELALAAIDTHLDSVWWQRVAPPFVGMIGLMRHAYLGVRGPQSTATWNQIALGAPEPLNSASLATWEADLRESDPDALAALCASRTAAVLNEPLAPIGPRTG
ncbi:MAG: hypothetical protein SGJ11_11875 [Phycisphaerae bacterium]|nr:hypothetical protein [Phycisphaerae bacterium]